MRAIASMAVALVIAAPASALRAQPQPEPPPPEPQPEQAPEPQPEQAPEPQPEPQPEQAPEQAPEQLPPEPEHTAADVATAPLPGDESGRLDPIDTGDGAMRVAGRALLFVPKLALEIVFAPVNGLLWLNERYDLTGRYYRTFYSRDRAIGVYPTLAYETNIGLSAGAGFIDKDTFGGAEALQLGATSGVIVGDVARLSAWASINTGRRLGDRVLVTASGNYDKLPNLPFFGIGNGDLMGAPRGNAVIPRIDPLMDSAAIETFYSYRDAHAALRSDFRLSDSLQATADGEYTDLAFDNSTAQTGPPITNVYDPMGLVGFGGVRHVYGGAELRWDTRERVSIWEPIADATAGSMIDVYGGRVVQLGGMPDFWRYGVDLQHYFHIARGPRAIAVRFRGDAVSGRRDQVPFDELPALGGGQFLRGYDYLRFRDRIAALGAVEYQWDLSRFTDAYLFSDVGRVYESYSDLSFDNLRVGFGLGLRFHSDAGFLFECNIASSIDGDVFVSAAFNPTLSAVPRWR